MSAVLVLLLDVVLPVFLVIAAGAAIGLRFGLEVAPINRVALYAAVPALAALVLYVATSLLMFTLGPSLVGRPTTLGRALRTVLGFPVLWAALALATLPIVLTLVQRLV